MEIASKSAEHRSDPEIWNYLGLAYMARDQIKKSRKAFEQSVDLAPQSSVFRGNLAYAYLLNRQPEKAKESAAKAIELDPNNSQAYHVRSNAYFWEGKVDEAERDADVLIKLDSKNAQAYLLKSEILIAKLGIKVIAGNTVREEVDYLKRAFDTLTSGVSSSRGHPQYSELEEELKSITIFYKHYTRDNTLTQPSTPRAPEPGVRPFRILNKPQASYTDRARAAGVSGTVRIVAYLGESGQVENVLLIKPLGYGLDQQAIKAAKKITFEPKMKDGQFVPALVTIEYSFTVY